MRTIRFFLVLLPLFYYSIVLAQDINYVDGIVDGYPRKFSSPEKLANRINSEFNYDADRVYAIYVWIANNIEYDVKSYYSKKKNNNTYSYRSLEEKELEELKLDNKIVNRTLKKRKAVCEGYSRLFKRICDLCEIESVVISGGTKLRKYQIGRNPMLTGHAWNGVKINNSWKLIDVTWGAGPVDSNKEFIADYSRGYFFTDPEKFYHNHYPKDTVWRLVNKTKVDFIESPLFYRAYMCTDMKIIYPDKGILNVGFGEKIYFNIQNISQSINLGYVFSNEKYVTKIDPVYLDDESCEFYIISNIKSSGYLNIVIDKEVFVCYKIRARK